MSQVTDPVMLDTTGKDIVAKLQDVIDAINGGTIDPLTVTQNGVYTPSDTTKGYGPVTVNVSSGGVAVEQKQVNFIDYDGTILHSYTGQEVDALTALPENPSHDGLVAQGWNWTLAQIKAQLTAMPNAPVWVGQMYITQSGDTEIDVQMPQGRLAPILIIAVNGTVTVDWGDGTTVDTVTGSSLTTRQNVSHAYSASGNYTIKIHVTSGEFSFYGSSAYMLLRKNTVVNEGKVYANCVKEVRLGSGITSIGSYAFYYCTSLEAVAIPNTVISVGTYAFDFCTALGSITIPKDVASIGEHVFENCDRLRVIAIPSGVTSIGNNAFQGCYCLDTMTIPSGVTSIGTYVYYSCFAMSTITIPNGVTSIGNYAFYNCYGIGELHFKSVVPPTINANVFDHTSSDSIFYVPSASLETYKTASGWSNYASRMVGE